MKIWAEGRLSSESSSRIKQLLLIYCGHGYQTPEQLTARYIKDTYDVADGIVKGTNVGAEESIPWDNADGKMAYMKADPIGQMRNFCYNPKRIR